MDYRAASMLAAGLLTMVATTAHAGEWPGWRRDAQRTAMANGKSDINKPAVRWRYFIGGSLSAEQFVAHDLDSDGKRELLYLAGGRLIAKEADDTLIWETKILRLTYIKGLFDLNGDGKKELLVLGKGGAAFIFSPADGSVCWETPASDFTQLGAVLIADLDGDKAKTSDLYLAELASASAVGKAAAYSFSGKCSGKTKLTAKELWSFKYTNNTDKNADRNGTGGLWDALADLDGDGSLEVVAPAGTDMHVYDGTTGKHRSKTSVGAQIAGGAWVMVGDVDGDKDEEILVSTRRNNSKRIWLMDWDKSKKTLVTRWERKAADEAKDLHGSIEDPLHDLDGDGKAEVVTSFMEAGVWTTYILDGAATGAPKVKASISGEALMGVADVDGDGRSELLTSKPDASAVNVRGVSKTGWKLGTARVISAAAKGTVFPPMALDRDRWARQALGRRVTPWDANQDKKKDLLLLFTNGTDQTLAAYDCSGASTPVKRASHAPGTGLGIHAFQPSSDVGEGGTGGQILTPRSDGFLVSLGNGLVPSNSVSQGGFKRIGMRAGGFMAAAPLVVDLDGDKKAEVLTLDSRGKLHCIDPAGANLIKPPKLKWTIPTVNVVSTRPTAADLDGDGKREVLVGESPAIQVSVYRSDGTKMWSYPKDTSSWSMRQMRGSLLAGDVSGDKVQDVVYVTNNKVDNKVYLGALHGKTGLPVWTAEVSHVYGGCGEGFQTLKDLDGDGVLDVVLAACKTLLGVRGKDGKVLNPQNIQTSITDNGPANLCGKTSGYAMLHDLDGDKKVDAFATGNFNFACALTPNWDGAKLTFKQLWTSKANTKYKATFAAPVDCGGTSGTRLVAPRLRSAELDVLKGSSGALISTLEMKSGSLSGYLTSAAAHADLAGDGAPRVLLGSDDGYLYAVKACSAKPVLDWSLYMRAPVAEVVLGDTDGDGKDEIVIASQDGFLNALGRERLPAPGYVYDNDGKGPALNPSQDIDLTENKDTLSANWGKVAGADGYEFAVLTSFGAILTKPEFIKAGDKTEGSATGLQLKPGQRYFFAVRAVDSKNGNTSAETISDGVLIKGNTSADGGVTPDGGTKPPEETPGCDCRVGQGAGEGAGALVLLLVGLLLIRRRR